MLQLIVEAAEISQPVECLVKDMIDADELIREAYKVATLHTILLRDAKTGAVQYFLNVTPRKEEGMFRVWEHEEHSC